MAKRAMKPQSVEPSTSAEAVTSGLQKLMPNLVLCRDNMSEWSYIDFCDPKTGMPCLPMEYLMGMRGFLVGRVLKWEADEGVGKSSLSLLAFGMGQRRHDAWCLQLETEDAEMPENRIAELSCDPSKTWRNPTTELVQCFEEMNTFTKAIRTTYDAAKARPIMLVVDSISNLAENELDDEKEANAGKTLLDTVDFNKNQPGKHARFLSTWFRNGGTAMLKERKAMLMLVGQLKQTIPMGAMQYAPPEKRTLGGSAINFHSSFRVLVQASKLLENERQVGDTVTMYTEKNKVAPRRRRISFDLYTIGGWDLSTGLVGCLKSAYDAHGQPLFQLKADGGWYEFPLLSDKKMRGRDMAEKLYANADLLMKIREDMRIYGYGFAFEKDYSIQQAITEADKAEEAEEAAKGGANA